MNLTRRGTWDPFRELEDLNSRFNQLLNFGPRAGNGEHEELAMTSWSPSCDISETPDEYRIHAELPAVSRDDVHVTLEDGVLTVQGDRREEKEEEGKRYHRRELAYGSFVRRFTMPADADETKVDATFKDGMLNVVIGRSPAPAGKAKEIEIR